MKIDIGESIIYSWLRHEKNSQVVQLNWKSSSTWEVGNQMKADEIFQKLKLIEDSTGKGLIGKSVNLSQFLRQAEIDALGISISKADNSSESKYTISAVDIAFHEGGLGYKDSHLVVAKKLARAALTIYSYFNTDDAEIIFASPKVRDSTIDSIDVILKEVMDCFEDLNFKFSLIFNTDFNSQIIEPVLRKTASVADTSELFSRSAKLLDVFSYLKFESLPLVNIDNQQDIEVDNDDIDFVPPKEDKTSLSHLRYSILAERSYCKTLKIGEFAKALFNKLDQDPALFQKALEYTNSGKIPSGKGLEILRLIDDSANINKLRKDEQGKYRYYSKPLTNHPYLLYHDWTSLRHQGPLMKLAEDLGLE
ncbi:hypothetical protein [Rufibacter roseolus]|uniref:hypothetical protein n=1 Tax=Rufibacter roseolus TaxID=2817375 RepID=UPI001B30BBCF|nr:hypothetical protein [Rufibacter roseolus]